MVTREDPSVHQPTNNGGREMPGLPDQVRQCHSDSGSTAFPNAHDAGCPLLLLKPVQIRIELDWQSRVTEILWLVRAQVVIGPQRLAEMLLNRAGKRGHIAL